LQQSTQVYFDVAWIVAESFLSGSLAETSRLKVVKELLTEIGDEALKPSADRGFVNMEKARDMEKGLPIEEVRRE
jgi:hypothetical protein